MALSVEERMRVKMHLGYPVTDPMASFQIGIPGAIGHAWLVDRALEYLRETDGSYDRVRQLLKILDDTETRIVESQERRAVLRADELTLNVRESEQLEGEYQRWGHRLADLLGVKPYMHSARYRQGASGVRSVPVVPG